MFQAALSRRSPKQLNDAQSPPIDGLRPMPTRSPPLNPSTLRSLHHSPPSLPASYQFQSRTSPGHSPNIHDGLRHTLPRDSGLGDSHDSPATAQVGTLESFFFKTLYRILEQDSLQRIISWSESGASFIVIDVEAFRLQVLTPYFDNNQFGEFVHRLCANNFRTSIKTLRYQHSSLASEGWEFSHPEFSCPEHASQSIFETELMPSYLEQSIDLSAQAAQLLATTRDELGRLRQEVNRLQLASPAVNRASPHSSPALQSTGQASSAPLQSRRLDGPSVEGPSLLFETQPEGSHTSPKMFTTPANVSPLGSFPRLPDVSHLQAGLQQRSPSWMVHPPTPGPVSPLSSPPRQLPGDYLTTGSEHGSSPSPSLSNFRNSPAQTPTSSPGNTRGRTPSSSSQSSSRSQSRSSQHPSLSGGNSPAINSEDEWCETLTESLHTIDREVHDGEARETKAPDCVSPDTVGTEEVRTFIRDIVNKILETVPTRLISTEDGQLYARSALHERFDASEEYRHLTALIRTKRLIQEEFICEVIRTYFQYATLSHRWRHSGEPQLADVSTSIFDFRVPSSFVKLRTFCLTARDQGLQWAWCDTCCINKDSSSELEEAVTSMFRWYRNSALTIVYISDVSGSSHQKLAKSEWFSRGWTLQELLAPRVMQFYEKNWKPCVEGSEYNHKEVQEWVDTLEGVTGIPAAALRNYAPGTDNPREKLRWAFRRTTTRKEDIGYCLIGIFDITLTIHYGEGDKAFARLLLKIMKSTHDINLFDWVGVESNVVSYIPYHPDGFRQPPLTGVPLLDSGSGSNLSCTSSPSSSFVLPSADSEGGFLDWKRHNKDTQVKPPPSPFTITETNIDLNCFIHNVKKGCYARITLPGSDGLSRPRDSLIQYSIHGVEDFGAFNIAVKVPLEEVYQPLVIARAWEQSLYDPSSDKDPMKPGKKSRDILTKPFVALLLVESSEAGVYRRIPTEERIVVRLAKAPKADYRPTQIRIL